MREKVSAALSLSSATFDQTPCGRRLRARRAQFHQHLFALHVHSGELAEPGPQPFQLPSPHRAFLGEAIGALGEDIELVVMGQQFDLDARPRLLPGLLDQMLLQPVQSALGRSHQILHGRMAGAHFRQNRLGGHAAIHRPDAPRLAELLFDLAQCPI